MNWIKLDEGHFIKVENVIEMHLHKPNSSEICVKLELSTGKQFVIDNFLSEHHVADFMSLIHSGDTIPCP